MSTSNSAHLPICTACGTQFGNTTLKSCRICDDPRQFVPASGQTFTTLAEMKGKYSNKWQQDTTNPRIWSIWTEPKFGIGQRALLLQTPHGNVLWDLISYLDSETETWIQSLGGLVAIVISHPHYYTTYAEWSRVFACPVYVSAEDEMWLDRLDAVGAERRLIRRGSQEVLRGVRAVKTGGHFDGSLVLLWEEEGDGVLFVADTLVTVPSAYYHVDRQPGTTSFVFMHSIPNMIPLPPSEIMKMWRALKPLQFTVTMGPFSGTDIRDPKVKERVLESMKIQVRAMGWTEHELLDEVC